MIITAVTLPSVMGGKKKTAFTLTIIIIILTLETPSTSASATLVTNCVQLSSGCPTVSVYLPAYLIGTFAIGLANKMSNTDTKAL